jgi:hypothetical protein
MFRLVAPTPRRLLAGLLLFLLAACGASAHGRGGGGDDDDTTTGDGDADGDGDPRPPCPEGDDLVLGDPCTDRADCDAPLCGHQGGVCIEETWTCGRCEYCFFARAPRLEDPALACNRETGVCE